MSPAADPKPSAEKAPEKPDAAAQAAPAKGKKPGKNVQAVEAWFRDRVHNGALSRHTPTFNVLREAVEDLKKRLAKLED